MKNQISPIIPRFRRFYVFFDSFLTFKGVPVGFLMHFRPFSVKKTYTIFPVFFEFRRFFRFFDDLLNIGLLPPPPKTLDSSRVPHCRFLKKKGTNRNKIGFPMPTPKNEFQILNLHPEKHILKKKTFFMYF